MPYKTEWVDPAIYLDHKGVKVWCTYKGNNIESSAHVNWYTLDPMCGEDECNCRGSDRCLAMFDVRDLKSWNNDLEVNEPIKNAMRVAIDSGELKALDRTVNHG